MKKIFNRVMILVLGFLIIQGLFEDVNAQNHENLLSKLIGTWDAKGISRNQDGTWKTDTTTSTWIWYKILNGEAIQDDWYRNVTYSNIKNGAASGTNIRIYNEKEKQWHMAWIDSTNRKLQIFTAIEDSNTVIMNGKNATGRDVRNIFYNISEDRFSWKQEWTFDGGKSWLDVSRIECFRIK